MPMPGDKGVGASHPVSLTLLGLSGCAVGFAAGYRLLLHCQLGLAAALFIGLPLLLGVVVALATAPRSPVGVALKGMALFLCVVAPLLGEAAIWVAAAAPLALGLAALFAVVVTWVRQRPAKVS